HTAIRNSAGNDEVEVIEIGGDVEGKSVAGDPAGKPHADGRQLFPTYPDAGQSWNPFSLDSEIGRCPNQHILQIAHVTVHVTAIGLQIENRIADDLTRTVIRDVAAAPGLMDFDASRRQHLGAGHYVRTAAVAAHTECNDMRVLE